MAFHKYHLPSNVPLSLAASPNDTEECTRESYSSLQFSQRELFAYRIKEIVVFQSVSCLLRSHCHCPI